MRWDWNLYLEMSNLTLGECICLAFLIVIVLSMTSYIGSGLALNSHESYKTTNCIESMQKAIPDSNDTEARVLFIKNNCN